MPAWYAASVVVRTRLTVPFGATSPPQASAAPAGPSMQISTIEPMSAARIGVPVRMRSLLPSRDDGAWTGRTQEEVPGSSALEHLHLPGQEVPSPAYPAHPTALREHAVRAA